MCRASVPKSAKWGSGSSLRIASEEVQVNIWHRVRAPSVNARVVAEQKARDLQAECTWLTHLWADVVHIRSGLQLWQ